MNYMTFHDFIPWIVIYIIALLVGIIGLGAIISELNKRYQHYMDSIQKKHHDDVERINDDIDDLKDRIINVLTWDEDDNPKVIQLSDENDIDYQLKRKYGYVLIRESEAGAIYKLYVNDTKIQTIQITLVEGKPSVSFINEVDGFNQYVPIGALRLLWLKYTYLKAKYHWVDDARK